MTTLTPRLFPALDRFHAACADSVRALDADPGIVARARELTPPGSPVTFAVADTLTEARPGSYDAVTCVATIHHLPLCEVLAHFRRRLTGPAQPGGRAMTAPAPVDRPRARPVENLLKPWRSSSRPAAPMSGRVSRRRVRR